MPTVTCRRAPLGWLWLRAQPLAAHPKRTECSRAVRSLSLCWGLWAMLAIGVRCPGLSRGGRPHVTTGGGGVPASEARGAAASSVLAPAVPLARAKPPWASVSSFVRQEAVVSPEVPSRGQVRGIGGSELSAQMAPGLEQVGLPPPHPESLCPTRSWWRGEAQPDPLCVLPSSARTGSQRRATHSS